MDDIISKLNDINSTLSGIVAMLGIYVCVSIFAFLILFFWYYDASKKDERKRIRKEIEREIKDEK